ncbi:MAG: hypothetical protein ACUVX8_05710 [Candidatus Zipacnadales bacterium]
MSSYVAADTVLGIEGTRFTVNGKPTFLYGISYYGALGASDGTIQVDLETMQRYKFNWFRVWATWSAFGNDVSVVDYDGIPRPQYMARLKALVAECDRRGMIVDITLSRGNGVTGRERLQQPEAHAQAVRAIVEEMKTQRNWYLDLSNEHNIQDKRHTTFEELLLLRTLVRELDPGRLVTASHAGDISEEELRRYVKEIGVDFIAPHRPRNAASPQQTAGKTKEYLSQMQALGRVVPVHYQEPFRRDFGNWQPKAEDFVADLRGAIAGGAAGWCLHNGDRRAAAQGEPRRSFDMRGGPLFPRLDEEEHKALALLAEVL